MKILNRKDVESIISVSKALETVERVYSLKSEGKTEVWPTVIKDFETGAKEADIKSGYLKDAEVHGLKAVNWTAANEEKGIPALVGVILLFDTDTGLPVGIVDGGYVTGIRTGAAGATGAKYLARKDSENLFVLGTGGQALFQTAAFLTAFPDLKKVTYCNVIHPEKAETFASDIKEKLEFQFGIHTDAVFAATHNMEEDVKSSHIIVTVTPSRTPLIKNEWIMPGTHLSCIGSDMSGKQEIEGSIFERARVFCDDKHHCIEAGEVEKAVLEGYIEEEQILGEIGDVITGKIEGRISPEDITIFDATGMAILDLLMAETAIKEAEKAHMGQDAEF